jgi:hypothetical protein
MKKILPVLLIISSFCHAQNYQCLQNGVKHYFINGNGYLRGIRIDSVGTLGSDNLFYPFHTQRGRYNPPIPSGLDTNGGSWLGKKVLQTYDGTFLFDNIWHDTVVIKTQANVGDSWVFYNDTTSLFYQADLIAIDTLTILGSVDSIKRILITARDPLGIVSTDPVDSFQIVLSKNNGFVKIFDLYTFPYHAPDSVYRPGFDYYLDVSSGPIPNKTVSIFNLTNFINPNDQQMHNWNVGDVIESSHNYGDTYPAFVYTDYIHDNITAKTVSGHSVNYTLSGIYYSCNSMYPCTLINNSGTRSFSDTYYRIIDPSVMPEEKNNLGYFIFYFPDDTTYCLQSPKYIIRSQHCGSVSYKLGIGETYIDDPVCGDLIYEFDELTYYNMQFGSCGRPVRINDVNQKLTSIQISPNPAHSDLNISSSKKITNVSIINFLGQTVYTDIFNSQKVQIDVADLPNGIYLVRINSSEVRKFVKE